MQCGMHDRSALLSFPSGAEATMSAPLFTTSIKQKRLVENESARYRYADTICNKPLCKNGPCVLENVNVYTVPVYLL